MDDPNDIVTDLTGGADPILDPTDAELEEAALRGDVAGPSAPLEELEAELTVDPLAAMHRVEVEGRPGFVAVYSRDFDGTDVDKWRAASKVKGDKYNGVKFAGLVVTKNLHSIERRGETLLDPEQGGAATFGSPWLQRLYGAPSAIEAARGFFASDGYLDAQAQSLLEAAGFGAEATAADPT